MVSPLGIGIGLHALGGVLGSFGRRRQAQYQDGIDHEKELRNHENYVKNLHYQRNRENENNRNLVESYNREVDFYNKQESERVATHNRLADATNAYAKWHAQQIDEKNRSQVKLLDTQANFQKRLARAEESSFQSFALGKSIKTAEKAYAASKAYQFGIHNAASSGIAATSSSFGGFKNHLTNVALFSAAAEATDVYSGYTQMNSRLDAFSSKVEELNIQRDSYFDSQGRFKEQKFQEMAYTSSAYKEHREYKPIETPLAIPEAPGRHTSYAATKGSFARDLAISATGVAGNVFMAGRV